MESSDPSPPHSTWTTSPGSMAAGSRAACLPAVAAVPTVAQALPPTPSPTAAPPAAAATAAAPAPAATEDAGDFITSPFVGTFYAAPRPEAAPFTSVGSKLSPGDTVCIVEAMKLFNEIEAEFACEILEVLVESGQAVEFGAKLFRVKRL